MDAVDRTCMGRPIRDDRPLDAIEARPSRLPVVWVLDHADAFVGQDCAERVDNQKFCMTQFGQDTESREEPCSDEHEDRQHLMKPRLKGG